MKNCMLFKAGASKTVHGIDCDIIVVSAKQVESHLNIGYFKTPEEVYADKNESGKLSNEEIRQAAKEAGIENWENGRIKTLKKALGYES